MSETTATSSQEILYSSQHDSQVSDETADDYQPSTQEISNARTQEVAMAMEFFTSLRDSQVMTTTSLLDAQHSDNTSNAEDLKHFVIDTDFEMKSMVSIERKKRGRKRKIRTPEEMVVHMKDKKEKNRLAAQRLRQRKCTEIQSYDTQVQELERNVRIKGEFAKHLETKVQQLRNKIKAFTQRGKTTDSNQNSHQFVIKSEEINSNNHFICISR